MGRMFFISGFRDRDPRGGKDMYVDLEMEMREKGDRHPGVDQLPTEMVPIINPETGEQAQGLNGPRFRPVKRDSALGFASEDFHYAGDRIVTLKEEVEIKGGKPTGVINHIFQRIDDQGRSLGTYQQRWEKEREGRMRSAGKARKYFSF